MPEKLGILGAQRIKALIEIANEKRQQELSEIQYVTREEVTAILHVRFPDLAAAEEFVQMAYGTHSSNYENTRFGTKGEYAKVYQELDKPRREKRQEIEAHWKGVVQKLWLCETLEEAKQLVGIK